MEPGRHASPCLAGLAVAMLFLLALLGAQGASAESTSFTVTMGMYEQDGEQTQHGYLPSQGVGAIDPDPATVELDGTTYTIGLASFEDGSSSNLHFKFLRDGVAQNVSSLFQAGGSYAMYFSQDGTSGSLSFGAYYSATGINSFVAKNFSGSLHFFSTTGDITVTVLPRPPALSNPSNIWATTDPTPDFTFTSDEAGTIAYAGGCASTKTGAVKGANTVTFGALDEGTYSDCAVTITDSESNTSFPLAVPTFMVVDVTGMTEVYSGNLTSGSDAANEIFGYSNHSGVSYGTLSDTTLSGHTIAQLVRDTSGTDVLDIRLHDTNGNKVFAGGALTGHTATLTQADTMLAVPSLEFSENDGADSIASPLADYAYEFNTMFQNTAEPITVKFYAPVPEVSLDFDGSGAYDAAKDGLFLYLYTETEALAANLAAYVHDGTSDTAVAAAAAIDSVKGGSSSPLDFDGSGSFVPDKDALFLYLYTETEALPANLAAYVHDGTAATAADAAEAIDALTQ